MVVLLIFAMLEWRGWRSRVFQPGNQRPSPAATVQAVQPERTSNPPAISPPSVSTSAAKAVAVIAPEAGASTRRRTADRLRRQAVRGNGDAPIRLANMYLEGKQVERSCDEAIRLLQLAAAKPNVRARNRLAGMYAAGACVQRDRVQAYRWLTLALAADPNDPWAQQNRALTWSQMTSEEREIAQAPR